MIVSAFEEGIMPYERQSIWATEIPAAPGHTCDTALVARVE